MLRGAAQRAQREEKLRTEKAKLRTEKAKRGVAQYGIEMAKHRCAALWSREVTRSVERVEKEKKSE